MCGLQMRQPRQRVRVEGDDDAGEDAGGPVVGPACDEQAGRPAREREACNQQEVVDQDRAGAEPSERRAGDRRHEERFGVRERVALRIEDVGVEEMSRIGEECVRIPREDPLVQHGVGIVVAREPRRRARERPGVRDRQRQEQRERREAGASGHAVGEVAVSRRGRGFVGILARFKQRRRTSITRLCRPPRHSPKSSTRNWRVCSTPRL